MVKDDQDLYKNITVFMFNLKVALRIFQHLNQ